METSNEHNNKITHTMEQSQQDYIKNTISDSIKSLKSKSKNRICIDTDTLRECITNIIESTIRFAESQRIQPKLKSVQQDIEFKAYSLYPSYSNPSNIPLQQAFILGAQWIHHISTSTDTDYKEKYESALHLAKSWYDHYFDDYKSVADLMEKHPQSYMSILWHINNVEKFLPNMFSELNNDDEWWNNYIKTINTSK